MSHAAEPLTRLIRAEITARGPIPFTRFMELALYHPVHGYYHSSTEQIGCQGDFYTSVSVGRLFGQLLAWQFSQWTAVLDGDDSGPAGSPIPQPSSGPLVQWVEAGAHDGSLARDILEWVQAHRPELFNRLEYWIVEPSEPARARQAARLHPFAPHVRWFSSWVDTPPAGITGLVFSNELLDAFPVHRAGWDAAKRTWSEWGVEWREDRFAWVKLQRLSPSLAAELNSPFWRGLPGPLLDLLPEGFTVDLSPGAVGWWREAAERLRRGHLLALDYGLEEHELLAPHRQHGTLRSYRRHQLSPDPLHSPGAQDLTAHVNFSAVRRAGETAGLRTEEWSTQGTFLTRIAADVYANLTRFGSWGPEENRQLQTLVHPQHLGQLFRVLRQRRY